MHTRSARQVQIGVEQARFFAPMLVSIVAVVLGLALFSLASFAQTTVRIYQIQGSRAASPLVGRYVDTFGLVTAVTANGFYLQDPSGDGDVQTSDGIYVYFDSAPTVKQGDCITIERAYVDEFIGKTELSRSKRVTVTDRCSAQLVTAVSIPAARLASDPATLFENYEGMLVQIEDLGGMVQGSTKRFGNGEAEIILIDADLADHLPGRRVFQAEPRQTSALLFVSNALGGDFPDVRWGDQIEFGVQAGANRRAFAILDYNFGKYQLLLLPNQSIETSTQPIPIAEQFAPTANDEVSVCSTNLYVLGKGSAQHPEPADFERQLQKRAKAIAEALNGCTIIAIQETGSLAVLNELADKLRSDYQLDYAAFAGSGYQADDSEFPLTTGLLIRNDRVTAQQVEMRQACSPVDYAVLPGPQRCPAGEFTLFDRPPLLADLHVRGDWAASYELRIISNHWKSKAGDENVNAPRRVEQAKFVATLVQERLAENPNAQIIVLGDLNDYYASQPVETLRIGVQPELYHAYELISALDRYSYIFNGASQELDHLLLTPGLQPQIAEVNILHNNSNFAYPKQVDLTTVIHASDHDPLALRLRPVGAATLSGKLGFAGIAVQRVDENGVVIEQQTTDDRGEFRFWNLRAGEYTVRLVAPSYLTLTQNQFTGQLSAGSNILPVFEVTHTGLELIEASLAAVPVLLETTK